MPAIFLSNVLNDFTIIENKFYIKLNVRRSGAANAHD